MKKSPEDTINMKQKPSDKLNLWLLLQIINFSLMFINTLITTVIKILSGLENHWLDPQPVQLVRVTVKDAELRAALICSLVCNCRACKRNKLLGSFVQCLCKWVNEKYIVKALFRSQIRLKGA